MVRVAVAYLAGAWCLAQIADIVVPAYGLPRAWIGVLISVLAFGLVPVLVGTWLFELTPRGLKRDTGAPPATTETHRSFDRVIMILLALAVGFFAVDKFMLEPGRDAQLAEKIRADALVESYGAKSIAVLPFVNMTGDLQQAYFSDGISEEILNLLAKSRDLRVISRSTSFTYRGDVNVREVAEALDVTYVLEGSVRKAGDSFRVTAQLIDGRSDSHVWSETWDRQGDDIFAIQEELASDVAEALHIQLARGSTPRFKTDPETYSLFLRARHIFQGYSKMDQDRQVPIRLLRTVLERDPEYVPAMLELAELLWYEARSREHANRELAALDEERIDLILRAISIAPNDAYANATMSWLSLAHRHDAQAAARYIQRALELDPSHMGVLRLAAVMVDRLRLNADPIELSSRTINRDVFCASCLSRLAHAYDEIGEVEKAQEIRQRRIDLVGDTAGEFEVAYSLMDTDPAAALEFFQGGSQYGPVSLWPQVVLLVKLGRRDEAESVQRQMVEEWGDDSAAIDIARGFAHLGESDKAWNWLQRALARDDDFFVFVYEGEDFPGLRDTPRWEELRRDMGVSEEQLAAIEFEMPDLGPG